MFVAPYKPSIISGLLESNYKCIFRGAMSTGRKQWLNQIIEEPLDPSLPICDAHHHLWYSSENDYTVEDLLQDFSGGHNIRRTVFIESSGNETGG
jgi:hypothetical protein